MNLLLFITILVVSFIIVRIGAIAFQLTGLEWSLAEFQALSCFTGTGFTTKESELITGNTQRRRIASVLIVLGHAGLVTMIATFANTLRPEGIMPSFSVPLLHSLIPYRMLPLANLTVVIIAAYLIYKIFTNTKFAGILTRILKKHIEKRDMVKQVTFEELMIATGGYGVSQVEICAASPVLGKTLLEANLRRQDITVLALERKGETMPNPEPDTRFLLRDKLVCFGKLGDIRKRLSADPIAP